MAEDVGVIGSLAGFFNDIEITLGAWEVSGNIGLSGQAQRTNTTLVSNAIANATFTPATVQFNTLTGLHSGPALFTPNGRGFDLPLNQTVIFRASISDFADVSAVPEPSSLLALGALAFVGVSTRRRSA